MSKLVNYLPVTISRAKIMRFMPKFVYAIYINFDFSKFFEDRKLLVKNSPAFEVFFQYSQAPLNRKEILDSKLAKSNCKPASPGTPTKTLFSIRLILIFWSVGNFTKILPQKSSGGQKTEHLEHFWLTIGLCFMKIGYMHANFCSTI